MMALPKAGGFYFTKEVIYDIIIKIIPLESIFESLCCIH